MNRKTYELLESRMRSCMTDSAHDEDHVYRVLYVALDIAEYEDAVDTEVLICACLLHDIGRAEQFENPALCHAAVGAEKARNFLLANGFDESFAKRVGDCIKTHRFRSDAPPVSIEAKILFDADKLDVTGAIGIARTIFYQGQVGEPLYSLQLDGQVSDGTGDTKPSFLQEYKYKLEGLYSKFYTEHGSKLAAQRQAVAEAFYHSIVKEAQSVYATGRSLLERMLSE